MVSAMGVGRFSYGINSEGNGWIVWEKSNHIYVQNIQTFQVYGQPIVLENSAPEIVQIKATIDYNGNGLLTWIQRDCSQNPNCPGFIIKGRPIQNYN